MSKSANGTGTVYKPKHGSKNLPFRAEVWIVDLSRLEGKRRISKNFKKRSQAEKWRDEMITKYSTSGSNSICDPFITFSQWLIFWLNTFTLNIKDATKTSYECYIERHINRHPIDNIQLKDLNVCDLQSYISYLTADGNLRDGGGLNVKSIRSMMLMVRKSLLAAVGAGLLDRNPADYITLPRLEQKPVEYLSMEEIKRLICVSRNERWGIFFPLAFMTGCRIGELGALRQSALKCENGVWYISVEGSLNRVKDYASDSGKKTVLRVGPTKNSKSRQIPIPDELVAALQLHFEKQRTEADLCGCTYLRDPYLFCNELGNRFVDPSTLRKWSQEMAEKAGIRNFYPHILRKSFATLASANMDIKNLSEILGHSSCNVSANYYIASDLQTKSAAVTNLQPFCRELLGSNL